MMPKPIVTATAVSVISHLIGGWLLSDDYDHRYLLSVLPAQQVAINLRIVPAPEHRSERVAVPGTIIKKTKQQPEAVQKTVTTQAPASNKVSVPKPKTHSGGQQGKRQQSNNQQAQSEPQTSAMAKGDIPVESEQVNPDSGASSEYRLIDKPHFSGRRYPPVYPYRARRMGQEGTVILEVKLDSAGKIVSLEVDSSSGYKALDKAAMQAVTRWHFKPLLEGGRGVPSRVKIPVKFRLS